jgi:Domain of unknown function (DUF305)
VRLGKPGLPSSQRPLWPGAGVSRGTFPINPALRSVRQRTDPRPVPVEDHCHQGDPETVVHQASATYAAFAMPHRLHGARSSGKRRLERRPFNRTPNLKVHAMIRSIFRSTCAAALCLLAAAVQAQPAPRMSSAASMPMAQMHKDGMAPADMRQAMASGMESMQKMALSGDVDKDFAMMMKVHHEQALRMAEMELMHGKSAAMKAMAQRITVAQKKEIAELDRWLAKNK